jgi:3,4-dihydroxy 2-butanone 4-phosphate synthase/GTP cyclohydrolase II
VDLCRLAGLVPAACIIEIMKPDGEMARVPDLIEFCKAHSLKMCSVAQIIQHRLSRESLITRVSTPQGYELRTSEGDFRAHLFQSVVDPLPHLVLTTGDVGAGISPSDAPTLVRMHRRHLLGDVFGELSGATTHAGDASSGEVLRASMRMIQREGRGAIVYLRTTDAGGGKDATDLETLLQAPRAKRSSVDDPNLAAATATMPLREYGVGCQILRALGLQKLRLISASRRPLPGLEHFGLEIVGYETPK